MDCPSTSLIDVMKHWLYLTLCSIVLTGCIPKAKAPTLSAAPSASAPAITPSSVGEFTFDQISGRGCGMTLWKASNRTSNQHFVLFNGLEDSNMEMLIDGNVTPFRRVSGEGESFYGQQLSQTFESIDGATTVTAEVTLGAPGEIESVAISGGALTVERGGERINIPVVGDAGC